MYKEKIQPKTISKKEKVGIFGEWFMKTLKSNYVNKQWCGCAHSDKVL